MRAITAALLWLAACGPAAPPPLDRAADGPATFRVASWNVHDLFDEEDRLEAPGALDEVPTAAEVEAKLEAVAQVLQRLDADVVLLQEVENGPLLGRLAGRAGYPEARLLEGNDPRGIDVALLSRWPVGAYLGHAAERDGSGRLLWPRDAVEASVEAGRSTLLVLGSHFSSHLSDADGARRHAQAVRLRELADAALARRPGALVVAGGDLNDPGDAASLGPLLGDGAWIDPCRGLPAAQGWTWSGGADRSVLDHLLLPASQASAVVAASVAGGAEVAAASDHRPVVLDLRWP